MMESQMIEEVFCFLFYRIVSEIQSDVVCPIIHYLS